MIEVLLPVIILALARLACWWPNRFFPTTTNIATCLGASFTIILAAAAIIAGSGYASIHGLYLIDDARRWLIFGVLGCAVLAQGGLQSTFARDRAPGGEVYAMTLLASAGAALMIQAGNTIALFVGLELMSLAVYALVGPMRTRPESGEALYKYLIQGAVFSGLFLYGSALHYGSTGALSFAAPILEGREILWHVGSMLMIVGLLFKVGAVLFHFWSPDAYSGAPIAVTAFMAGVVKIGGFAALGTLLMGAASVTGIVASSGVEALRFDNAAAIIGENARLNAWSSMFLTVGMLSLLVGNFAALTQRTFRRMMAYSSIAHAGYLCLGMVPATQGVFGFTDVWVYVVAYGIATTGAIALVGHLCGPNDDDNLDHLTGTARQRPLSGMALTILLASLAGLPPTAGFIGKFLILGDLVRLSARRDLRDGDGGRWLCLLHRPHRPHLDAKHHHHARHAALARPR